MSENFSAEETFAIYGDSETTITFVQDEFFTEEKDVPDHGRCRRLPEGIGPYPT